MSDDKHIVRPTIAVALNYDEDSAPRVTAKGTGDIAEHIMLSPKNIMSLCRKILSW